MATIQATNVTNLSQGSQVQDLGLTQGWKVNPLLGVAAAIGVVAQGYTSNRYVSLGEFTAGAVSENAAITGSALPTLDADNGTLACGGISYELTSQALNSVLNKPRLLELLDKRALEAVVDYVASDSTVGLSALISTLTTVGVSGSALTQATISSGKLTICNAIGMGNGSEFICILDMKGITDIKRSFENSGAAAYANQAMSPQIAALFERGAMTDSLGFTGYRYDGVNYFQVNRGSSQLYTSGTDTYGLLCSIPGGENSDVASAIILDVREKPGIAREMLPGKVEHLEFAGVPITRYYGEPATTNANAFRVSYVAEFDSFVHNAGGAVALRYATS